MVQADGKKPPDWAWEIVSILRERGVEIELIKADDPGSIVYGDGRQITAKPNKADRIRWAKS